MSTERPRNAVNRLSESGELLVTVSRRLFIAVVVLAGVAVVVGVLIETRWAVSAAVTLTGTIGGFVGLQRRLKQLTVEDLRVLANSWVQICLPPLIGGVLAMLLYVIFMSGLITGSLFPNFVADTETTKVCPSLEKNFRLLVCHHGEGFADYAKLVFWSFVAGFSERFVTDIIGRFEGEAVKSAGADRDAAESTNERTDRA